MNFGGTFTRPLGTSASLEVWAKINVTTGTNTFTVAATDFRTPPNTTTQSYQVVTTATGTNTLTYDLNGNCLSDGTRTYEWDAKNQLVAINYTGTNKRTEFVYDGQGHRVKIIEKDNGSLTSAKILIWVGSEIVEERDATNTTTKQYYSQGFVLPASGLQPPVSYFYTRDHLGSIREVTDSTGATHARYEYDPYGRATKLSGDVSADFLYTGHYYHALSNLYLAKYRAYDPNTGRWLSRDPIAENGGINLYGYVGENPINYFDKLGLERPGYIPPGNQRPPPTKSVPPEKAPVKLPPPPAGRGADPGTPGSTGDAVGGAFDVANGQYRISSPLKYYDDGIKECLRQSQPTGCKCCVIVLMEIDYNTGIEPYLQFGNAHVENKPCSQVKKDDDNNGILTAKNTSYYINYVPW